MPTTERIFLNLKRKVLCHVHSANSHLISQTLSECHPFPTTLPMWECNITDWQHSERADYKENMRNLINWVQNLINWVQNLINWVQPNAPGLQQTRVGTAPLPPFGRTFSEERDGLPERSQAGFHFRVISGHVDLPGSLPALKLSQHFCLPLAHMIFQIKNLT